jgi:hypothetical protein
MTGEEARALRERAGLSREESAALAGVGADVLASWESSGVPARDAARLDRVLWEAERDKALAKSGLPECAWVRWWDARPPEAEAEVGDGVLESHVASCPACQARDRYVEEHVRPVPLAGAPFLARLAAPLPPWLRAAAAGALVILLFQGVLTGALAFFLKGRWPEAAALLGVCVLSGGAAGLVYHWTRALAGREWGPHLRWVLAAQTYLLTAAACIAAAATLDGRLATRAAEAAASPLFLTGLAAVGVVLGVAFGYADQRRQHKASGDPYTAAALLVPAVGALGALFVLAGVAAGYYGWREWPLLTEAAEPPQEVTLRQLLDQGFGTNRYVRVKGFRFCAGEVVEKEIRIGQLPARYLWLPLVPEQEAGAPEGRPPAPRRLAAVACAIELEQLAPGIPAPGGGKNVRDVVRRAEERKGYEGVVVDGRSGLPSGVRSQLAALAPDTDFGRLLVLDRRVKPASAGFVYGLLGGGAGAVSVGLALLGVAFAWAVRQGRPSGVAAAPGLPPSRLAGA